MLSALALAQTFSVGAAIGDAHDDQRFSVFVPSVNTIRTLSRSGEAAGALNGATGDSVCHASCMPIVTLVLPVGVISSTLLLSVVQSVDSVIMEAGQLSAWSARYR